MNSSILTILLILMLILIYLCINSKELELQDIKKVNDNNNINRLPCLIYDKSNLH